MAGPPIRREEVTVGGIRVHARVALAGAPVPSPTAVLVHGLGVSSRYFEPLMRVLGDRLRLHAPDLPGFGRSQSPDRLLGLASLASAVIGYLDARGIDRAALVGNSFGCQIAIQAAWMHPERVERLVLQGPTIDDSARTLLEQVPRWMALGLLERPSLLLVLARDYLGAGLRRTVYTARVAVADRPEDKLRELTMPVLVVRGRRDVTVGERWARKLAELAPDGRLVQVASAAHAMCYSHPELLAEKIAPFLLDAEPARA